MPGVSSTSSPRQGILGAAEYLAAKGRKGDTHLTHTTTGETIVPEELLAKNPNLRKDLRLAYENEDIPMEQYVVGSGIMSVNPETGLYEAGWASKTWKSVRKTVKKAGPVIGAIIGGVIAGPAGAAIGAGVGTKTSAQPDENILRNMAIAFGASAGLQGAGIGGASTSANTAAQAGGGWFGGGMGEGVGAFFSGANWTPMAAGQTGVTGFFQNAGSGAGRSLGLGGTASFQSAGLTAEQAKLVQAEMASSGLPAVDAALKIGITDPTIISNLGSVSSSFGPGLVSSGTSSYASLNPLEKWAVQTGFEAAVGINQEDGSYSGGATSPYLTSNLRSGPNINAQGVQGTGIGSLPGSAGPTSLTSSAQQQQQNASTGGQNTVSQNTGIQGSNANAPQNTLASSSGPGYETAMERITKGSELLDMIGGNAKRASGISAPQLASLNSPFPTFQQPVYAQDGGLGSDLVEKQVESYPEMMQRQISERKQKPTYTGIEDFMRQFMGQNPVNPRTGERDTNAFRLIENEAEQFTRNLSKEDRMIRELYKKLKRIQNPEFGVKDPLEEDEVLRQIEMLENIKKTEGFQAGGIVGENRPMFRHGGVHQGGGKVSGPGGEREDLVNAKLSNNEFVMTADAVRGAGNGSIQNGADKMYKMMNNFERMA